MTTTTFDAPSENLRYVRKVYAWLLAGISITSLSAYTAVSVGTPVAVTKGNHQVLVPPLVASFIEHPVAGCLIFLGLVMLAGIARKVPVINVAVYFVLTTVMGLFLGPSIFATQLSAAAGNTISAHPVHDALALTMLAFGSLTTYVFVSRRDFSAWNGFLMTGLLVLIGAGVLNLFMGSLALHLALASVGVILFMGYILFDTSRLLHKSDLDDPIGDALNLLLDVLNLFVNLLQILGAPVKRD